MKRQGKFFWLVVLVVGLIAGGIGGAVVGAITALSLERGLEPPLVGQFFPTLTPTATLRATSTQTAVPTPIPTWTPSPTTTPTNIPTIPPTNTPTSTPTATQTASPIPTLTATPSPALADLIDQLAPSVVTILISDNFRNEAYGFGSGVVLLEPNIVVTNYHVIENAPRIRVVTSDEREAEATLIAGDFFTDLAVLRVDQSLALTPLTLSTDRKVRVGEGVFAIGSALGDFRNSVTSGIVSGLERMVKVDEAGFAYEGLIQTDTAINRGNSGGPLFDMAGHVVGINTLVVRSALATENIEGLGFSIPATTVEQIARLILTQGKVSRPFFGIQHQELTPFLANRYQILAQTTGEVVLSVEGSSPAEFAGIEEGDLLLGLNGQIINQRHPFINLLMRYRPGDRIEVRLLRDGIERSLSMTLAERD